MSASYIEPDREVLLAECIASANKWTIEPGRNLVMLFDGTGNILGSHQDTNVVKLLRLLRKNTVDDGVRPAQIVYYDPGVGATNEFPASSIGSKVGYFFRKYGGLALGSGAFANIAEAYKFLVRNYRDGDRIFLFGFSRGAFTARAVGGMINMYGLIQVAGLPLIRALVHNYFARKGDQNRAGKTRKDFANEIIKNFSLERTPLVHFTGVWDSVETIGSGFLGGVRITNSKDFEKKRFVHVRHALSLHETRCKYKPRRYITPDFSEKEKQYRSFDERWFRGAHSDVGGSYRRDGLSKITLKWMIDEATAQGLWMDHRVVNTGNGAEPVHDQTYENPYWVWTGLNSRQRMKGDVIDPSALPVGGAVPASQEPRTASFWQIWGMVLAVLTAGLFWKTYQAGHEACSFDQAHAWVASIPSAYQLLAPWHRELGIACDNIKIHHALTLDWFLLASYALWLAYPVTWALRRLVANAIPQGRSLAWLPCNAQWLMVILVLADILENLATYWIWHLPWILTVATTLKLMCIALLAIVFVAGVAVPRMLPQTHPDFS